MVDLPNPQELVQDVYWLGMRRNVRLESNAYVLLFERKSGRFPLLIDPGGRNVIKILQHRLEHILGSTKHLPFIFLSDQDPSAGVNVAYLLRQHPSLAVLCTDDVCRLAYLLGIASARFQAVEKLKDRKVVLSSKHVLHFLPVPFCPSRGSCMLYDERNRILFSGGLFGGITFTVSLFATPHDWEGIRMWHQMYIPHQKALQQALALVKSLHPPPLMIAPKYGAILKEDLIPVVLEKLSTLPVGMDLPQATEIDKVMYIEAINDVLDNIASQVGSDIIEHLLQRFDEDLSFPHLFRIEGGRLIDIKDDILGDVMGAFKMFLYAFLQDQSAPVQELVRKAILQSNWDLPLFMESFVYRNRPAE